MKKPKEIILPSQEPALAAVGKGIRAFVMVESGLAFVFASLLEPKDRATAVIAINAAWQTDTKIRIIRSVVEYKLQGDLRSRIEAVLDRCQKRAAFRNKLAHYQIGFWPGIKSAEEAEKLQLALLPPITSPKHDSQMWGDETPLGLNEIDQFTTDCHKLFLQLLELSNALSREAGAT